MIRTCAIRTFTIRAAAFLAALSVAACAVPQESVPEWDDITAASERAWAEGAGWMPFAQGTINILAREGRELRSYSLTPCRGGETVCAGSLTGRAGEVDETRDFTVVSGLYGRVFYLSPGGDGVMMLPGGEEIPLVWGPAGRAHGTWVSTRLAQGSAAG